MQNLKFEKNAKTLNTKGRICWKSRDIGFKTSRAIKKVDDN